MENFESNRVMPLEPHLIILYWILDNFQLMKFTCDVAITPDGKEKSTQQFTWQWQCGYLLDGCRFYSGTERESVAINITFDSQTLDACIIRN